VGIAVLVALFLILFWLHQRDKTLTYARAVLVGLIVWLVDTAVPILLVSFDLVGSGDPKLLSGAISQLIVEQLLFLPVVLLTAAAVLFVLRAVRKT